MAWLDDSRMDRPYGHLQHAFSESRPVDVALPFEGRQHGFQGKVLAQGINVRPIVMQGDAAGIGVSNCLQTKPILDFALLPVERRQGGGERGKLKTAGSHRRLDDQILRAALLFEDIVEEENAFGGTPVLREYRNQPRSEVA